MEDKSFDIYYGGILPLVEKPSRYIGGEMNLLSSGFREDDYNILLAFPDVYEIGMSYQGIKVLYQKLRKREKMGVEFLFAPWPDMEKSLRVCDEPLRSLDTGTPVKAFDLLGFSLTYELHYTNLLMMLSLGRIPLKASHREESCPLVIAGGACATNPLPVLEALDAVFLGDAEESLVEAAELLRDIKDSGGGRAQAKEKLSMVNGVYVPEYSSTATVRKYSHPLIEKHSPPYILPDMDPGWKPVVPSSRIVHDRLVVEVQRGCSRGCRFCQAGMLYRPCREREPAALAGAIEEGLKASGWKEVSLLSLSTSDYSRLEELVSRITPALKRNKTSIAMPSLRPETVTGEIIEALSIGKRSGFTIAPEAGTERLRRVINKGMSDQEIIKSCRMILDSGWRTLKLYFMIGLPTETEADLDGIVSLIEAVMKLKKGRGKFRLNVTISPFVPKPHTPFQWERQSGIEELEEKERYLSGKVRDGRVNLHLRNPEVSVLEGIMARGDTSLWPVLVDVVDRGGRFEGWTDHFDFGIWKDAISKKGMEIDGLISGFALDAELPWDRFRAGVKKSFLLREREKAFAGELTDDCRLGSCQGCGVCDEIPAKIRPAGQKMESEPICDGRTEVSSRDGNESGLRTPARFRCRFSKTGEARFLSHRELVDLVRRALRRTGLPIRYSGGFHPHARISMAPALPVGAEGEREFFDFELSGPAEVTPAVFEGLFPRGISVESCSGPFTKRTGKLSEQTIFHYYLDFDPLRFIIEKNRNKGRESAGGRPCGCPPGLKPGPPGEIGEDFLNDPAGWFEEKCSAIFRKGGTVTDRKGRNRPVAGCEAEKISRCTLELRLPAINGSGLSPKDLLQRFMPEKSGELVKITRKGLYYLFKDNYVDPVDMVDR